MEWSQAEAPAALVAMIQGVEMAAAPALADPEPANWPKATPTYPEIIRRAFLASVASPGTQLRFEASVKQGSFENPAIACDPALLWLPAQAGSYNMPDPT